MAWLWNSWAEYVKSVEPVACTSPGSFVLAHRSSLFVSQQLLYQAVEEVSRALESLQELGFKSNAGRLSPRDSSTIGKARDLMIELVHAGEALLLHHKRLAVSRAAYGFLHQHDVLEHWERYNEVRLSREIDQMVVDTHELLRGYRELLDTDERFLLEDLRLPDDLQADFRLARNLFSIGLDDVG